MKKHMSDKHPNLAQIKCRLCDKKFSKNCELERNIFDDHDFKPFKCEKCDKTFVLRWRLRKHLSGHETKIKCYYFNNGKDCPFEMIGCKFRHELPSKDIHDIHEDPRSNDESFLGTSDKKSSFFTSTPKRRRLKCNECRDKSMCEDCALDEYVEQEYVGSHLANEDIEYVDNYIANEELKALD